MDALCPDCPGEEECDCPRPYVCTFTEIEGICVERGGKCALGDDCRCKKDDTTEGGW